MSRFKKSLNDSYVGVSTEEKPTQGIEEYSLYKELDTGETYYFYNNQWFKMQTKNSSGGGTSGDSSLPSVTLADNDSVLMVVNGEWGKGSLGYTVNNVAVPSQVIVPTDGQKFPPLNGVNIPWSYEDNLDIVIDDETFENVEYNSSNNSWMIYKNDTPFAMIGKIQPNSWVFASIETGEHTVAAYTPHEITSVSDNFSYAVKEVVYPIVDEVLPEVSTEDNGDVLTVVNGRWQKAPLNIVSPKYIMYEYQNGIPLTTDSAGSAAGTISADILAQINTAIQDGDFPVIVTKDSNFSPAVVTPLQFGGKVYGVAGDLAVFYNCQTKFILNLTTGQFSIVYTNPIPQHDGGGDMN